MKYQVSIGIIADPRGKSVRARRSENVTIRQIASCCHEDNARTGNSRSSHACSSHGRGSCSKQPCIDPRDQKVLNEADSPRGHSLSDVTCPTSILIGRTYVEDDLRLLGPSPSCGSRSNAPCPDAYSGKSRQFQNYDEFR